MCECIKCGKTYASMFVAWILGKEHRVCAMYPACGTVQTRLQFLEALTTIKA